MDSRGKRSLLAMQQTLLRSKLNELVSIKLPTLYRYMLLNEYSIYQRQRPFMTSYTWKVQRMLFIARQK